MFKSAVFVVAIVLVAFAVPPLTWSETGGRDPDNFRGVKWGTDISSLSDMERISENHFRFTKAYRKKDEKLTIGEAKMESIEYDFLDNKFCGGVMYFEGQRNFEILKATVYERFGPAEPLFLSPNDMYMWNDVVTEKFLNFDLMEKTGYFSIKSTECDRKVDKLLKLEEEYKKEKVKEGAASSF